MNIVSSIHTLRDAIAKNEALSSWCNINFNKTHTVCVGMDEGNPMSDDAYPVVWLLPTAKRSGYRLETQAHVITVVCGVRDETEATVTNNNVVEMANVALLEDFRALVEAIVVAADLGTARIDELAVEYEVGRFFPYLLAAMEFTYNDDYYQGKQVFA